MNRKEIREAIKKKTGRDPQQNFTILKNGKVKVLWSKGKTEIIILDKHF